MSFEVGDEVRVKSGWTESRLGWAVVEGPAKGHSGGPAWLIKFNGWPVARPIGERFLIGRSPLELLARVAE